MVVSSEFYTLHLACYLCAINKRLLGLFSVNGATKIKIIQQN